MTIKCPFKVNQAGLEMCHENPTDRERKMYEIKCIDVLYDVPMKLAYVTTAYKTLRFMFVNKDTRYYYYMFPTEFQKVIDDSIDIRGFFGHVEFVKRGGYYGIKLI